MKILVLLSCFVLAACVDDGGRGYGYGPDYGSGLAPGYGYGPGQYQQGNPGRGYQRRRHDDQGRHDRDRNDFRRDGWHQGNWGR